MVQEQFVRSIIKFAINEIAVAIMTTKQQRQKNNRRPCICNSGVTTSVATTRHTIYIKSLI